jgi:hypothetical protein
METINMKTKAQSFLILFALIMVAFIPARADFIKSTYVGPPDGNWGDPANWSPAIVPNNGGGNYFAATISNVFLTLELDVKVSRLIFKPGDGNPIILGGTAPLLFCLDHDFSSAHTKIGYGGIVYADAESKDVTVDLGELADFSGTTLGTGNTYYVVTAEPGRAATMKFDGANIVTNTALIELIGANARLTDENGANALAHFRHNAFDGYFDLEVGRNFTTEGAFVNEGGIAIFASDPGSVTGDLNTTLTINGNFTDIGYPLDANTDGLVELLAPGPDGDAQMIINGALTNYDADTHILNKSYFAWEAANGAGAVTRVLGGRPIDVFTSKAALFLIGPNTGLRDKFGNDALRNLAVSARLLIGDRNFTTADSFVSTSRLSVFGGCRFTVSGHLTIRNGFFEVSPLTGYAWTGDPGFPTTRYKSSVVTVRGNFNLPAPGILRFHVLDHEKTATINVKGAAVFAGSLQAGVEKLGKISASDSFTVLTAANITGQFSNVTNGGRVEVFRFDQFGTPIGKPIGTFLVNYDKTSLTLSDFQRNQSFPARIDPAAAVRAPAGPPSRSSIGDPQGNATDRSDLGLDSQRSAFSKIARGTGHVFPVSPPWNQNMISEAAA